MTAALRWEKAEEGEVWLAYRGQETVGMVAKVTRAHPTNPRYNKWGYSLTAVNPKWIAKGHGHVASKASAKRAVERAWATWCAVFGMKGIEE